VTFSNCFIRYGGIKWILLFFVQGIEPRVFYIQHSK
jgi:hypothetical protein